MSLKYDSPKKNRKERNILEKRAETAEAFDAIETTFLKKKLLHEEPSVKGQVRIIGGKAKNIRLDIPRGTRPVTDRMKTSIFDVLRSDITNRTVLDLFAGSGSFGLEAISRGASHVTLVDVSKIVEKALIGNIRKTGFLIETEIIRMKVEDFLTFETQGDKVFEIIFMDPPYKSFNTKDLSKITRLLDMTTQLLPGYNDWNTRLYKGVIIVKHPRRYPIETLMLNRLRLVDTYTFGSNAISILALTKPD